MPRFGIVEVYPTSGWWDRPWIEGDPDGDAFAKVARGICDAYSSALAGSEQQHTVSTLRILVDANGQVVPSEPDARRTVVLSPSTTDRVSEGFEGAAVRIGEGFAALALDEQRRIALDVVHAAARGMAQFRGLELAAFERARAAVVAAGHEFTWSSEWKSSPGRRWRARCSFRSSADGFGRLTVQVSTTDGSVSATSSEQVAWTTMEGFARAAKTLRWTGTDRVEVVPCVGLYGFDTGVFAVEVDTRSPDDLRLHEAETAAPPASPRPRSSVPAGQPRGVPEDRRWPVGRPLPDVALVVPDATTREIRAVGGGPTNDVPQAYWTTLHALFAQLDDADWRDWWAPADLPTLEVSWSAGVEEDRLFVRRGKDKVIARIERTSESLRSSDPAQAARDDLAGLMATVQGRMGLATPPDLR